MFGFGTAFAGLSESVFVHFSENIMNWLPKKTVVVPVDFSVSSAEALKVAMQFVVQPKDLHVIHVALPPAVLAYGESWAVEYTKTRLEEAGRKLSKFVADNDASGATQLIREGDPGLLIADYASEHNADLIVIPSHGYHGVQRVLLGSVAERVLRHAKCPILVLRRPN